MMRCSSLILWCCAIAGAAWAADAPSFSLAWSEYPSWSTFGVAHELGLINGKKGELGPLEKKWNVDIELKEAEYDPCITMYGSGGCDAVCITNMDVLNPALGRPSVAILPTSTSLGADALIVKSGITDVTQLKGKKIFGLAKSVSEYCFVRNLEILGQNEKDYVFTNMDPGAAATAMQQKQEGYDAIIVWNPFVLQTLKVLGNEVRVLFDSTAIPGEIIDMVVVARESLAKPGGQSFACAVIDTFYQLNAKLEDPATRKETLVMLGKKFSSLNAEEMEKVVQQTRFYKTAAEGLALFSGTKIGPINAKVSDFCVSHAIVPKKPALTYERALARSAPSADLIFDATFMGMAQKGEVPVAQKGEAPKDAAAAPGAGNTNTIVIVCIVVALALVALIVVAQRKKPQA